MSIFKTKKIYELRWKYQVFSRFYNAKSLFNELLYWDFLLEATIASRKGRFIIEVIVIGKEQFICSLTKTWWITILGVNENRSGGDSVDIGDGPNDWLATREIAQSSAWSRNVYVGVSTVGRPTHWNRKSYKFSHKVIIFIDGCWKQWRALPATCCIMRNWAITYHAFLLRNVRRHGWWQRPLPSRFLWASFRWWASLLARVSGQKRSALAESKGLEAENSRKAHKCLSFAKSNQTTIYQDPNLIVEVYWKRQKFV